MFNGKSSNMTNNWDIIDWFIFIREEFLWCYSVYSSRSFPYTLIDPSSTEISEVLFPLVDALNHKPNTKITWSRNGNAETGSLSFIAGQVFENGVEIFNNYGPKVSKDLYDNTFLTKVAYNNSQMKSVSKKYRNWCNIGILMPFSFNSAIGIWILFRGTVIC